MKRARGVSMASRWAALAAALWAGTAGAAEPRAWTGPARGPQSPAGPFSYDRAYDLGALWREAQAAGWGAEDAVVLLEKHEETWTADGRRVEERHRVVRIATDLGIEAYADLRVPYDSVECAFTALALRTFRDGRWIESGPTAQVETTPDAFERAPAYAWLRERMLLHDGVEVPCLVETAWRIEDRRPHRGGIWGLEVFPRADPVVRAEFAVFSPAGAVRAEGRNGAGEGASVEDAPPGLEGRRWRLDRLDPAESPGPDPGADLPCVAWSSWSEWSGLGAWLLGRFDEAGGLSSAQRDTLRARLRGAGTPTEVARRVAALVGERTRPIEAPERWWGGAPRRSAQIYDEAYGTPLDRATLAGAALREAGLRAEPVFAARSFARDPIRVPGLDRFQPLQIAVLPGTGPAPASATAPEVAPDAGAGAAPEILGLYDPASSTFEAGARPLAGRVVWRPAGGGQPEPFPCAVPGASLSESGSPGSAEPAGRVSLALDLRFDGEAKAWIGRGVYAAAGVFAPFGRMEGLDGQSAAWLGSVVSGVLPGAEVAAYNPSAFEPGRVVAGISVKLPPPEADDRGRARLEWGSLAGAIASLLPAGLAPHRGAISHSVFLPGPVAQELRLRLLLPESKTVRLPEVARLENGAGGFALEVERDGDAVTLTRSLRLERAVLPPSAWPDLRELLLAESHDRHRVILYEPAGGDAR